MSKFGAKLSQFVNVELHKGHRDAVAAVEDYVYNFIVATSPVDTGAYRANHNRSENGPDYTFVASKTSGKQPSPVGATGMSTFYVSNGAPYAQALEDGHSQQGSHIYANAYQSAKSRFKL